MPTSCHFFHISLLHFIEYVSVVHFIAEKQLFKNDNCSIILPHPKVYFKIVSYYHLISSVFKFPHCLISAFIVGLFVSGCKHGQTVALHFISSPSLIYSKLFIILNNDLTVMTSNYVEKLEEGTFFYSPQPLATELFIFVYL